MDYKDIEQLLERYWQCETSVEEEATLRDFFAKEEVPAHLLRYKNLFVYQQVQQEVGLGEDFDARILAEVEPTVVKAKRLTLTGRFIPLFKAAAVIAIILSLGNVAQHSFSEYYYWPKHGFDNVYQVQTFHSLKDDSRCLIGHFQYPHNSSYGTDIV